jgi:hypothetical protein
MDKLREYHDLMAHVARLDENNIVVEVIVISNDYEPNVEEWAYNWANGGIWKQTSYNATIRKNFAGIGFYYDQNLDAFIPPRCHTEAILDEASALWNCENGEHYAQS